MQCDHCGEQAATTAVLGWSRAEAGVAEPQVVHRCDACAAERAATAEARRATALAASDRLRAVRARLADLEAQGEAAPLARAAAWVAHLGGAAGGGGALPADLRAFVARHRRPPA